MVWLYLSFCIISIDIATLIFVPKESASNFTRLCSSSTIVHLDTKSKVINDIHQKCIGICKNWYQLMTNRTNLGTSTKGRNLQM